MMVVAHSIDSFRIDRTGSGYFGDEIRLEGWFVSVSPAVGIELLMPDGRPDSYELRLEPRDGLRPAGCPSGEDAPYFYTFELHEKLPPKSPDWNTVSLRVSFAGGELSSISVDPPDDHAGGSRDQQADSDVIMRFESCGDQCEFGLLQRKVGLERMALLRYGGVEDLPAFTEAVAARFKGFAEGDDLQIFERDREWMSFLPRQQMTFHTGRLSHSISRERIYAQEQTKLKYLAEKFIEDLEAAEKIFVYRTRGGGRLNLGSTDGMLEYHTVLRSIGPIRLLWVTEQDAEHVAGLVVPTEHDGLYRGYVRHLAPFENAFDTDRDGWLALLRKALKVIDGVEVAAPA